MHKGLVIISSLLAATAFVVIASAAVPGPPAPTVSQLKAKIADLRSDKADLQDQVDAQDLVLGDQADTIQRLRTRLANQPDPLDVITSRGPDGLWAAMRAIWLAFPAADPGAAICGYDRSNVPGDGDGLTVTSYSFYRTSGC